MPEVPEACQSLAAELDAIEGKDAGLRLELETATGQHAWAVLARLGECRRSLDRKRRELEACIRSLHATLVAMDISGLTEATRRDRVAFLWDAAQPAAPRETRAVLDDAFSFARPLPAQLSISVSRTGDDNVQGPEFRSTTIAAEAVGARPRIEIIIAPEITVEQEEMSRWWGTPSAGPIVVQSSGASATASLISMEARPVANSLDVRITGQLSLFSTGSLVESLPYSANVTVHLMPAVVLDPTRLCEVSIHSELQLRWEGYVDTFSEMLLPLIKSSLTPVVVTEIGKVVDRELTARIHAAFALTGFPPGVTVSLRRLAVVDTVLRFQPILGALGEVLSTFTPPTIPPP